MRGGVSEVINKILLAPRLGGGLERSDCNANLTSTLPSDMTFVEDAKSRWEVKSKVDSSQNVNATA